MKVPTFRLNRAYFFFFFGKNKKEIIRNSAWKPYKQIYRNCSVHIIDKPESTDICLYFQYIINHYLQGRLFAISSAIHTNFVQLSLLSIYCNVSLFKIIDAKTKLDSGLSIIVCIAEEIAKSLPCR
jgi:hypothetical protein